jgi:hypothetical protein
MTNVFRTIALSCIVFSLGAISWGTSVLKRSSGQPLAATSAVNRDTHEIMELKRQIASMQDRVAGQGTVMTRLTHHFSNIWFAMEDENWALADYYLDQCRSNLKWAIRIKPVRTKSDGQEINLAGIAGALDNTQFSDLSKAIKSKNTERAVDAYQDTIIVCNACHVAVEMPYLRITVPTVPESAMIEFDPNKTAIAMKDEVVENHAR